MIKIVVMISGNGSNLQAILDACQSGELSAAVVAVVSDNPLAYGLKRAEKYQIPTMVKSKNVSQSKSDYEKELCECIQVFQPDWIVLAGWMKLLSSVFLNYFPSRVINLHPALPHAFPGLKSIERAFMAFKNGEIKETGVMVHLVPDEKVDNGPVLKQASVSITDNDTLESLTQKMHETEHKILVEALIELERTHKAEKI
jgi:phosphoribosylglycinamide formyltransferase-1